MKRSDQCIYCEEKADSWDHFPPKSFFRKGQWPKSYVFPACKACNNGKGEDEQVINLFLRMQRLDSLKDPDLKKYHDGVRMSRPSFFNEVKLLTGTEKKHTRREIFGDDAFGDLFAGDNYLCAEMGPDFLKLVSRFCCWLGQALYFQHLEKIHLGDVFFQIYNLSDLKQKDLWNFFSLHTKKPTLSRNGKDLSEEFCYRYVSSTRVFSAFIWFGLPQKIFHVMICRKPGLNEKYRRHADEGRCCRISAKSAH